MPTIPTKQQVRDWMQQRVREKRPVPSLEEIRRQLGWGFVIKTKDNKDR